MTTITINEAPEAYKKILRMGDAHGGEKGYDGMVNTAEEAGTSATKGCVENKRECLNLIEYLESSGFTLTDVRQRFFRAQLIDCGAVVARNVQKFVKDLKNTNPTARRQAVSSLSAFTDSTSCYGAHAFMVDSLLDANNDPNEEVQKMARRALVDIVSNTTSFGTSQRILRRLAEALNIEDPNIPLNSYYALHDIIEADLNPALVKYKLVQALCKIYEDSPKTDTARAVCATRLLKQIAQNLVADDPVKTVIEKTFKKPKDKVTE